VGVFGANHEPSISNQISESQEELEKALKYATRKQQRKVANWLKSGQVSSGKRQQNV